MYEIHLPVRYFWDMIKYPFAFSCLCLLISSCGPDYLLNETRSIAQSQWAYQDTLNFAANIRDTNRIYNIFLDIDHSTDYPYQNIYLLVHTLFPGGKRPAQRISVDLADKSGQWLGNCRGEYCQLRVYLQQGAFFNARGQHIFTIEQYMRVDPLPGIRSIALRIEDTGQNR